MKVLVNRILELAQERIGYKKTPPKLTDLQRRIQDGFDSDAALSANELMAKVVYLTTGYRPVLKRPIGRPFEIWMYKNGKTETSHVGMVVAGDKVYGCSGLDAVTVYYDCNCRPATEEEAVAFLKVIEGWEDGAVCKWVAEKVGSGHVSTFLGHLEM